MRASQAKGVCNAKRFLFHHVVDALTGQSGAHVLGNLTDEAVGDDGDVPNAGTPNGAQCIVDDGTLMDREQGLLRVAGKRR